MSIIFRLWMFRTTNCQVKFLAHLENLKAWNTLICIQICFMEPSLLRLAASKVFNSSIFFKHSKYLEKFPFLQLLNLSLNNLEGEVPNKGVFKNSSAVSVIGNRNLCGGVPELKQSPCSSVWKKQKVSD